jgi:hypothetical protein
MEMEEGNGAHLFLWWANGQINMIRIGMRHNWVIRFVRFEKQYLLFMLDSSDPNQYSHLQFRFYAKCVHFLTKFA